MTVDLEQDNRPRTDGFRFPWGAKVAWMRLTARDWTCVHRSFDGYVTFCMHEIPSACDVSAMGSGLPSMGKCSRCETLFGRAREYREREMRARP